MQRPDYAIGYNFLFLYSFHFYIAKSHNFIIIVYFFINRSAEVQKYRTLHTTTKHLLYIFALSAKYDHLNGNSHYYRVDITQWVILHVRNSSYIFP